MVKVHFRVFFRSNLHEEKTPLIQKGLFLFIFNKNTHNIIEMSNNVATSTKRWDLSIEMLKAIAAL